MPRGKKARKPTNEDVEKIREAVSEMEARVEQETEDVIYELSQRLRLSDFTVRGIWFES